MNKKLPNEEPFTRSQASVLEEMADYYLGGEGDTLEEDSLEEGKKFGPKGGVAKAPSEVAYDLIQSGKGDAKSVAKGVVKYTKEFHDRALTEVEIGRVAELLTTYFNVDEDDADFIMTKATEG